MFNAIMAEAQCTRKKRRCLSFEDKQKLISDMKAGKHVEEIASEYAISKSQAYRIYKQKDTIVRVVSEGSVSTQSKIIVNRAKYPVIDRAVFQWFCSLRSLRRGSKPLPVSRELLQARAMHEAKALNIADFKASNGWFMHWRWRYCVTNRVRLLGEAGDVDLPAAEQQMQQLRDSLRGYLPCNVFYMDEAGLFYRAIPNQSYLMEDEGDPRQARRGSKAMKAKERLTVILCVNATGSLKIAPVVIGLVKNPRCFKKNPPSIPYFHQKKAWNDTQNFSRWWNEVFLCSIRKWTRDPVALLLDGFSGHDDGIADPFGQVKIFKFPPNVTSIYQPLDQGIIAALKVRYKSNLLAKLVQTAGNNTLLALAEQLPAGCAGVKYGCLPHVGDAVTILKEAWDSILPSTIAACWGHAHCLPLVEEVELTSDARDYRKTVESEAVKAMCSQLASLAISEPSVADSLKTMGLDAVAEAAHRVQDTAASMLMRWLCLEEACNIADACNDEEELNDETPVSTQQSLDRIGLLNKALPLLKDLHAIGVQLDDAQVMNTVTQLCVHVQESAQSAINQH